MKLIARWEVPQSPKPRMVNLDGGVLGAGDKFPNDGFLYVRYAGSAGAPDVIKKFENKEQ